MTGQRPTGKRKSRQILSKSRQILSKSRQILSKSRQIQLPAPDRFS
jgi:hypothetical protein